ncbi:uncharacterized protein LOC112349034 [Selaginella moellendorffii]|uniref:uncharacterized protein LOC112349034 n=1 Tax=Selaginella moellendorffii TaxID=88036 RepID=UPI000D1CCB67|nr:uncharacterized protein LOC112349034 [Selaginella moellendorffii]|eukprot:XP_024538384.1 uncharacterized protein LOC112349034 [Selaginella moellendorffii]
MGVFSSRPKAGVILPERVNIRGSKWRDEEEFLSRVKRMDQVRIVSGGDFISSSRVDWSDLVQTCFSAVEMSNVSWLDSILLCAAIQAKIGERLLVSKISSSTSSELIVLDEERAALEGMPGSIVRIHKASEALLLEMVAKHPVVTSIRCTDRRSLVWMEDASLVRKLGYNPQPLYGGMYDLDRIPSCALLIGYDRTFWTLFDPAFSFYFKLRREESRNRRNGVGEFILVPLVQET